MSNYFEIRKQRRKKLDYQRPEQPKLERALLTDGDPRQAESAAWLKQYHQQKEALRGKGKERIPLDPRLADPTCERRGEAGQAGSGSGDRGGRDED